MVFFKIILPFFVCRCWLEISWWITSSWLWDVWAPQVKTSRKKQCGLMNMTRGHSYWICWMLQVCCDIVVSIPKNIKVSNIKEKSEKFWKFPSVFNLFQVQSLWHWYLWKPKKELMLWMIFCTVKAGMQPPFMVIALSGSERQLWGHLSLAAHQSW